MRRRVIDTTEEMLEVISRCDVCYVSMVTPEGLPYVVPMNFGFGDGVLILHGAREGMKMDILAKNPNVCIAFSTDHELRYQNEQVACSWSMKYRSVLLSGKVEMIDDFDEKVSALNVIMRKYAGRDFTYSPPAVREVQPFKITGFKLTGRAYGL